MVHISNHASNRIMRCRLSHRHCGHASGERITRNPYLPMPESKQGRGVVTILEHNATLKILGCVTLSCVFG
jgi:hypothetical protein